MTFIKNADYAQSDSQISSLRIGTWNVCNAYKNRLLALRDVTQNSPADIWVLTETHDDLIPYGCEHVVYSEPRPKNFSGIRPGSRWVSIWSRFPLKRLQFDLTDGERTVLAQADLGFRGKLIIYGTVLPWKEDRKIPGWSEHHRVIEEQSAEWISLHQTYPGISLCIAGDYNSDMSLGRRYGTKLGVDAIERGLAQCDMFCATEPERFPHGLLNILPIDHIALPVFWKENTSVVAAWPAARKTLSDHSGMVVEVSF